MIEGIRKEIEKLGLELIELDPSVYGTSFLMVGRLEQKKYKWGGGYIKNFEASLSGVVLFLEGLKKGSKKGVYRC